MPLNQTGPGATANVGTYNDVAGNQYNSTDNSKHSSVKKFGNISAYPSSQTADRLLIFLLQLQAMGGLAEVEAM
jgi:hypothetical protein